MSKRKAKKVGFLGCPSTRETIAWFVVGFIGVFLTNFAWIILTR